MRFRPANISLINRRHYLPRLLLTLSSKRQIQKPPQRFEDVDRVTPYQLPASKSRRMIPTTGVSISPTVITQPHIVARLMSMPASRRKMTL